MLTPGDSTHR